MIIDRYFPEANILMNTAGIPAIPLKATDTEEIRHIGKTSLEEMADFLIYAVRPLKKGAGRLILGYDYYHYSPDTFTWDKQLLDTNSLVEGIGGNNIFKNLKQQLYTYGISTEVTEQQGEPWDGFSTVPGNNAREYIFSLLRSLEFVREDQPAIIRMWGVEELAKAYLENNLNSEQKKIIAIIQLINNVALENYSQ